MNKKIVLEFPDRKFGLAIILSYAMTYGLGGMDLTHPSELVAAIIMFIVLALCMAKIFYKLGIFAKGENHDA